MTEYHVQELAPSDLKNLEDAEQTADDLAQVSGTPYAVYVLVSTYYPTKQTKGKQ